MPFPLSLRSSFVVDLPAPDDAGRVRDAVADVIRAESPQDLKVSECEIAFRGGVFRLVTGMNQLVAITRGSITFTVHDGRLHITYRLTFTQMLLIVTCLTVAFPWARSNQHGASGTPIPAQLPVAFLIAGWLWLFGGNYVLTMFRFRRLLRTAAESAVGRQP